MTIAILIGFVVSGIIAGTILLRIYIKARHGDEAAIEFLKTRILYSDDFPDELKPYMEENWRKYGDMQGVVLVNRYLSARRTEGDWFSLDRFLVEEKERINKVYAKRLSTKLKRRIGIDHKVKN